MWVENCNKISETRLIDRWGYHKGATRLDFFIQVISLTVYIDNTVLELKAMLQTLNLTVDLANNKNLTQYRGVGRGGCIDFLIWHVKKNPIESAITNPMKFHPEWSMYQSKKNVWHYFFNEVTWLLAKATSQEQQQPYSHSSVTTILLCIEARTEMKA